MWYVAVSVVLAAGTTSWCSRAPPSDQPSKTNVWPPLENDAAAEIGVVNPIVDCWLNGAVRLRPAYETGAPTGLLVSVSWRVSGAIVTVLVVVAPSESVAVRVAS